MTACLLLTCSQVSGSMRATQTLQHPTHRRWGEQEKLLGVQVLLGRSRESSALFAYTVYLRSHPQRPWPEQCRRPLASGPEPLTCLPAACIWIPTKALDNSVWWMVDGPHFIQRFSNQWPLKIALQYVLTFTHSCTHSNADGGVNHARWQPARLDQLGFELSCSGTPWHTRNLAVTSQPTVPPE